MSEVRLDELDRKILLMISEDARVPFLEVARACNVSGAAIHQRIQKLTSQGVIKGSQFIINPEKTGYDTCAYLGLKMKNPSDIDHVLEGLQNLREVVECHYAMSDFDLFVKVYAKDHHHLLSLVQNEIQPLGLVCCKTILSFGCVINRQIPMSHLSDDEI